ncbi:MAG TPA: glycoside hydrolase family 127 protein, partial [Armatimonadota bacterium]|nr:glycoside hydrolase family 127 protein [Armatimonadota bacterium]
GDRLEKIAYNALPAPFSPDMWAHQYDQQANQVMCKWSEDNWWTTNLADSGLYGLEPNCGCCTANMHQGWPKFVSHLWMATPDDGLAAVAYGPCVVSAKVKGDVPVTITVDTDYPFDEIVCMSFSTPKSVKFPLQLRIPDWAEDATISINGKAIDTEPGTFATVDRVWEDGDKLNLRLPMKIRIERRFNNSATILRGPLVYSLKIGEEWTKVAGEEPHADYQVMPTTPWNYGLILDMENPEKSITVKKKSVGKMIYSSDTAPIELHVKGRIVPEWKEEHAGAGMLPVSPVKSSEPIQDLVLIPYGCAKLRVTEFPVLDE